MSIRNVPVHVSFSVCFFAVLVGLVRHGDQRPLVQLLSWQWNRDLVVHHFQWKRSVTSVLACTFWSVSLYNTVWLDFFTPASYLMSFPDLLLSKTGCSRSRPSWSSQWSSPPSPSWCSWVSWSPCPREDSSTSLASARPLQVWRTVLLAT